MDEHNFPYAGLKLLATKNSAGKIINFQGKDYVVEETTADSFDGVDLALFAGGPASREFGRLAQSKGVVVIDNSSTFRLEPDVPLIIPEVNGQAAKDHQGLIANPNCSTILMVGALYPLYKKSRIDRIVVSTYQAVSGAGKAGISELTEQARQILDGEPIHPEAFQHQIAFNLIPHIDVWQEEDYTKEEMKLVHETHKILDDYDIKITPTAVRVPVFRSMLNPSTSKRKRQFPPMKRAKFSKPRHASSCRTIRTTMSIQCQWIPPTPTTSTSAASATT